MSIADHFDRAPDAGFIRTYEAQTARRQFQVSLALILMLAAAAFALGMLVRFDEPTSAAPRKPVPVKASEVHFAGHLPATVLPNRGS